MEVFVEHLGALQFRIKARKHTIDCDQPEESGGFDEGMTPPELLLASLGACAGFYAAQYLKKHGLATEGTAVHVSAEKAANPPRMDKFTIKVEAPLELTEDDKRGVEEAVHHCLIHNTLLHPPNIAVQVIATVVAAR